MFEKEAEEYANGKGHEHYNYLFEENAGTPATFANWCFKDGAEFGYNKANEWHYVKDGIPIITEKGRWLNLILKDRRIETFWWNFKSVPQRVIDNFKTDVIAWKEIVLPKESE